MTVEEILLIFFSFLLTHKGSHREAYRDFQPSFTSSAGGAKGRSDHRYCAPPAYTAQLLTLTHLFYDVIVEKIVL